MRDGKLPSGLSNDTREALAAEAEYYQLEDLVERLTPTAQKIVEYKTVTVNFNGSWRSWREQWQYSDRYSKRLIADMCSRDNVRHERLHSERGPFRPTSVLK